MPFVKPVRTSEVFAFPVETVIVSPVDAVATIVYEETADPPLSLGADHRRATLPFDGVVSTHVGALGAPAGMKFFMAYVLEPEAAFAAMRARYC